MSSGFHVDPEAIRAHAENVALVRDKFAAAKSASAHIAQNADAYGLLCSWMPAILESRHTKHDELVAYIEENLSIMTQSLISTAQAYESVDGDHDSRMRDFLRALGR